jgi:hypothetical protein
MELKEAEIALFSNKSIAGLLLSAKWKKAIGLDNLPADVFKCCVKPSADLLHSMFKVFWSYQLLPQAWQTAFITPIPKRGADLRDPAQWREIALQSHFKKLFGVCVRRLFREEGWTDAHIL